jgi:hypothetical protein
MRTANRSTILIISLVSLSWILILRYYFKQPELAALRLQEYNKQRMEKNLRPLQTSQENSQDVLPEEFTTEYIEKQRRKYK